MIANICTVLRFANIGLSIAALAMGASARADPPPLPGALRCEFASYASAVAQPPEKDIKAEVRVEGGIDPLVYAALNPSDRTAQLVGNIGAARVTMIATAATWSFVEVTDAGNITVTQVFLSNEPEAQYGRYRAIHSRHSSLMGVIVASQHYGHCKALN